MLFAFHSFMLKKFRIFVVIIWEFFVQKLGKKCTFALGNGSYKDPKFIKEYPSQSC